MIIQDTKIESYTIGGKKVFVKREDLCAPYPLPPLAKMRGVNKRLLTVKEQGFKTVGVFDTKVSMAGYGVSILAKQLGMECVTFYSGTKEVISNLPPNLIAAQRTCRNIVAVKPGRTPICYSYAKKAAESAGFYMMPQGLACTETSDEVEKVAAGLPKNILGGSLIIVSGTGTILSGIIKGIQRLPANIVSVSACISPKKQYNNILRLVKDNQYPHTTQLILSLTEFLEPVMDYYTECNYACPFDCNRHYDRKAWQWLNENINILTEPVLFWNIGGDYDEIFKENN